MIKFRQVQSQKQWGRRGKAHHEDIQKTCLWLRWCVVLIHSYFSPCYSSHWPPWCLKIKLQPNPVTQVQNNTDMSTELQCTPRFIFCFCHHKFVSNIELNFVTRNKICISLLGWMRWLMDNTKFSTHDKRYQPNANIHPAWNFSQKAEKQNQCWHLVASQTTHTADCKREVVTGFPV